MAKMSCGSKSSSKGKMGTGKGSRVPGDPLPPARSGGQAVMKGPMIHDPAKGMMKGGKKRK